MTAWAWVQTGLVIVCGCLLVYREFQRRNRKRLVLRLTTTLISISSLLFLIQPLSWKTTRKNSDNDTKPGILITPGFDPDSIALFQSVKNNPPIYNPQDLYRVDSSLSSLHVFGYGLPAGIVLPPAIPKTIIHQNQPLTGFVSVSWNQQLIPGGILKVQGKFINPDTNTVKIYLQGFSKNLDSVIMTSDQEPEFNLETVPSFTGRAVYRLIAVSDGDTLENNPIPVIIKKPENLSVLILSSTPDFDSRFLQDWLVGQGFSVAVRVRTSRDKMEKRYYGLSGLDLGRISVGLTSAVDIIIADAAEIIRLGREEKKILFEAVAGKGLGLILRSDSLLPSDEIFSRHFKLRRSYTRNPSVVLKTKNNNTPVALSLSGPLVFIENKQVIQSIISDSSGKILMGTIKYGAGYVGVSAMPELFSLALTGHRPAFARIWSEVLGAVTTNIPAKGSIQQLSRFPQVNEPVDLEVISPSDSVPAIRGYQTIRLSQQALIPFYSRGKYWPSATGWQDEFISSGDTMAMYVYDDADWKNVRAEERLQHTKQLVIKNNTIRESTSSTNTIVKKIPSLFFYLMLTLSMVFLWVEKKFV